MDDCIIIGSVHFYPQRASIERDGKTFRLTAMEARILSILASYNGALCSFQELNRQIYGTDETVPFVIFIRHIRQKIEVDPLHPDILLTVPGLGYRLNMP